MVMPLLTVHVQLPPPVQLTPPARGLDKLDLLSRVHNSRFDRGGLHGSGVVGLKPFLSGNTLPSSFQGLYSAQELEELKQLQSTDRDVEARMSVKITTHYLSLALQSEGLMNLVKARPEETLDLAGSIDPSNQNKYSPIPGLLHKYEMVLLFVARTCSAHCRYCYRFDLFTNKSGKTVIRSADAAHYIKHYNGTPSAQRKYPHVPVTEALLSGGDPMVLPNTALAEYIIDLAEAGVQTIRIGTKELAFFPYRFDSNFFAMLDLLHAAYPHVRLVFSLHFTHPAEFLKMEGGEYQIDDGCPDAVASRHQHAEAERMHVNSVRSSNGGCYDRLSRNFKWLDVTERAIVELNKRGHFITLRNQTPIIRKVNDNSEQLALLQKEMFKKGIGNHYIFQCRDIHGKKEFAVPVEESWHLFTDSQRALSGMEKQARFVLSAEKGKLELVGCFEDKVVFRLHRSSFETNNRNIVICKRNPGALWIDDYTHLVMFDPFKVVG